MWKRIVGALVVLVALIGGIYIWMSRLSEQPVAIVQSYLEAINRDDIPAAYGNLAPVVRSHMSLDQFRSFVEHNSKTLKSGQANFPFRQFYYRGGTLVFQKNSERPPGGGFPDLSETILRDKLNAGTNNVAVIRAVLNGQGSENVKMRFVLMEEPDSATGTDRWLIYDFRLGEW